MGFRNRDPFLKRFLIEHMRMFGKQFSAASTRSSLGLLFRLTLAIADSSESSQAQAAAVILVFLLDLLEHLVFLVVSHRRSRDQVHGTDEEQ